MIQPRLARDTVGGLFFAAIGLAFILAGDSLPMGDASRMASGYFPRLLGYCLVFLGLLISIKGTFSKKKSQEVIYRFCLKKVGILGSSLLAFAFFLEPAGLVPALSISVFISTFATEHRSLKEALAVTLAVDILMIAVFVGAIGLEINLLPSGWFE